MKKIIVSNTQSINQTKNIGNSPLYVCFPLYNIPSTASNGKNDDTEPMLFNLLLSEIACISNAKQCCMANSTMHVLQCVHR